MLYCKLPFKREVIYILTKKYSIQVIEYHSLSLYIVLPCSSTRVIVYSQVFTTTKFTRKRHLYQNPHPLKTDSIDLQHLRIGHLNKYIFNKLVEEAKGVQITLKGLILKQDYIFYYILEARYIILKRIQERLFQPFAVISINIFNVKNAYNRHQYTFVFKEQYTGLPNIATTSTKTVASLLIKNYYIKIEQYYSIVVLKIILNLELTLILLKSQYLREFKSQA